MARQFYVKDRHGNYTPAEPKQILKLASNILATQIKAGIPFQNPKAVKEYCACQLGLYEHEVFAVLCLDTKHRMISFDILFRGTIDGASVYPREVVKHALGLNSAAVICVHNHPSGIPEPSSADQALTRRLKSALALLDIRMLDHIIVAGSETDSLSERGLM